MSRENNESESLEKFELDHGLVEERAHGLSNNSTNICSGSLFPFWFSVLQNI